jgi:hypothetical protein
MERDNPKKIGLGWANFAAVAMETQKTQYVSQTKFGEHNYLF